jgi:hypothetical protein
MVNSCAPEGYAITFLTTNQHNSTTYFGKAQHSGGMKKYIVFTSKWNSCANKTSLNPPRFYWTTCIMPGNDLVCLLLISASFYNVGIVLTCMVICVFYFIWHLWVIIFDTASLSGVFVVVGFRATYATSG